MNKAAKLTAALAMMGLLAFAAAGCGGDDKSATATGDTLKFGVTNFADSLEPTDNYFGWVVMRYGLGECLVKFDEKMNAVPWLAETWTFKINDKAVFSNGNKVTGEAVKKSIERTFEKAARAHAMFEPASITADGQNVMITTQTPVATLPGMLGDPLFIIVDTSVTDRDYASQGPICTGPYVVKEYSKTKAVMDANPNYWDGEVPYKHVEIPTIDDPNTRAMALQSGEIDMAVNIAPGDLQLFEDKDKFNISTIASLRDVLARINVADGKPMADNWTAKPTARCCLKIPLCRAARICRLPSITALMKLRRWIKTSTMWSALNSFWRKPAGKIATTTAMWIRTAKTLSWTLSFTADAPNCRCLQKQLSLTPRRLALK